eukprot:Sspe_Gene.116769::Locus_106499_Transcript_1_1_Confidence_1.000_Length_705::g.116769::m.116769
MRRACALYCKVKDLHEGAQKVANAVERLRFGPKCPKQILIQRVQDGKLPNEPTFSKALKRAITDLRREGHAITTDLCNTGLSILKRHHREIAAMEWVRWMQKINVPLDQRTYHTAMAAFAARGDVGSVRMMEQDMKEAGFAPTGYTYAIFLQATVKAGGDVEEVVKAMEAAGIRSNVVTYTIRICACKSYEEVAALLPLMVRDKVVPDSKAVAYSLL